MRMSRFAGMGAILVLAGLNGCGGSSEVIIEPPLVPVKVTIVDGNNQSGILSNQLSTPLTVEVTSSGGGPMPNVKVDWAVAGDGGKLSTANASFVPTVSVLTDAQGRASVVWTLGGTAGVQSVSAAVTSVSSPAVFSATAVAAPIVLHYDGATWSTSLRDNHGAHASVGSVWGSSASDIFVAGRVGCGSFLVHYDGTSWGDTPTCSYGSLARFTSLWGSSPSDAFVVGTDALPPWFDNWIAHYDGQSWTRVYSHTCSFCFRMVRAVWSTARTNAFAVGDSGVVLHYDGTTWTPQSSGTTQDLKAVWGVGGSGPVFAVGDAGTILSYDGSTWRAQASGTTQVLAAISGTSTNDVFVVGAGGTILHSDGTTWAPQTSGTTQGLNGVWASSSSTVFAVGAANTILRYDGTRWTAQATTVSMDFGGVWGTSPTNVFVVGQPR